MDHLWSPWRYRYLQETRPAGTCIFCEKPAENQDEQNFIVHRAEHNFVILNLYPYTTGHLMIAPYEHAALIDSLPDCTLKEMFLLARDAQRHLGSIYQPHGYNLGMNLGEAAGAGIAEHLHLHVLPRWRGDANFLSTVGETRVLPEELSVTYAKLSAAFRSPA